VSKSLIWSSPCGASRTSESDRAREI